MNFRTIYIASHIFCAHTFRIISLQRLLHWISLFHAETLRVWKLFLYPGRFSQCSSFTFKRADGKTNVYVQGKKKSINGPFMPKQKYIIQRKLLFENGLSQISKYVVAHFLPLFIWIFYEFSICLYLCDETAFNIYCFCFLSRS